jgi:hypothetical protein
MRRLFVVGALAAIGAAALAIPASGAQSIVFHVDGVHTGTHWNRSHTVVTFTNRLFEHGNRRHQVGHNRGRCRPSTTRAHCHITFFFPNGKIKTQGRVYYRQDRERLPVIGGTRAFNGVGGKLIINEILDRVTHYDFFLVR